MYQYLTDSSIQPIYAHVKTYKYIHFIYILEFLVNLYDVYYKSFIYTKTKLANIVAYL